MRVLVREDIGSAGVRALENAGLRVETGFDWDAEQLERGMSDIDGILVRSATQLTSELIERAHRLKVIGRAGVGVDNVDVEAATARGIVVVNAPESNVVSAAEHTLGLLLALARKIPQAHASLTSGHWERNRFSGVELAGRILGVLGLGRIGTLVAERAQAFGMRVIAFDPYVAADRFERLGIERAERPDELYAVADFVTIHLPNTAQTEGWLDARAFAQMKDGVRILNVARGSLVVDADLQAALDSGKVAGAALDVFRSEPMTDHPLFGRPDVVVTPHLGASTAEATDRAGAQAAEQVIAALTGGSVTSAVNLPATSARDLEELAPWLPLCRALGRLASALSDHRCGDVDVEALGRIGERNARLLGVNALVGVLAGTSDEEVNEVNAPLIAQRRGIDVTLTTGEARDYSDLVRVSVGARRVAGTLLGHRMRPHLLEAWGQRFNLQLEEHITAIRYRDAPGMVGVVGSELGSARINIASAAVGHRAAEQADEAVMVLTTTEAVPEPVLDAILAEPGFHDARSASLSR